MHLLNEEATTMLLLKMKQQTKLMKQKSQLTKISMKILRQLTQSTDSIVTDELANGYRALVQNYVSLLDYYNFVIQDQLGIALPSEEAEEAPVEGDDVVERRC